MKLREQFGENSFDAVYAIEATCHAPSWEGIYGEIKHVLKPGGKVSSRSIAACRGASLTHPSPLPRPPSLACTSGA